VKRRRKAMRIYSVYDVFTPTAPARINFVPRAGLSDQLVNALNTPGMQVVVYGESGSGKSTLLKNKLEEIHAKYITTRCTSETTFSELLLDAFDRLGPYYVDAVDSGHSRSGGGQLGGQFLMIKASVEAQVSKSSSETSRRLLSPQLTPQRLVEFLAAQDIFWVIEDFHKVPVETKRPLAETFKIFSDLAATYGRAKIVAVGATDTAREVVEYDSNMANRVAEVLVPLMTVTELLQILNRGQELLNINLASATALSVANFSVGLGAVCHRIALNACLINGVQETTAIKMVFSSEDFDKAIQRYLEDSSDTVKALFDRALAAAGKGRFANTRLVLEALARGPIEGLRDTEILESIRKSVPTYPKGNVTVQLKLLASGDDRAIIRQAADGRFRFSQPVYHFYAQAFLGVESSEVWDQFATVLRDFIRNIAKR
jgi:hypothetical protein